MSKKKTWMLEGEWLTGLLKLKMFNSLGLTYYWYNHNNNIFSSMTFFREFKWPVHTDVVLQKVLRIIYVYSFM